MICYVAPCCACILQSEFTTSLVIAKVRYSRSMQDQYKWFDIGTILQCYDDHNIRINT